MTKIVPCEVYTRIVGYYRPVQNWNAGKQREYKERVEFNEETSMSSTIPTIKPIEVAEMTTSGETVSSTLSKFKLFSFPDCDKCETVKDYLKTTTLTGEVVDLKSPEGNKIFQGYYRDIRNDLKRNDDNTVILPVVLALDTDGKVMNVAQTLDAVKSFSC